MNGALQFYLNAVEIRDAHSSNVGLVSAGRDIALMQGWYLLMEIKL